MARIRTIKPEFPQSESMGRVSRDARLLFIQLWTICDDEGRTRGNSRMLASLLFPYDEDAPKLIDGWLDELEAEGCLVRYRSEGNSYIEVRNWLIHQKIDKPSKSKIPPPENIREDSARIRERSSEDQGSRIKDQGPRIEGSSSREALPIDDDHVPKTEGEWANHFSSEHGVPIDATSVHSRKKFWPIANAWCKAGVTLGQMRQACREAVAGATEPIVFLPSYVDRILANRGPPAGRMSPKEAEKARIIRELDAWKTPKATPQSVVIDV